MQGEIVYKICSKCQEKKLFSEFHKDSSKLDGLRTTCKICKSISDKNYKTNNLEICKTKDAKYYLKNKEKIDKQSKKYYEENKERLMILQKEYNKTREDFIVSWRKDYYDSKKNTTEYILAYRAYYEANKDAFLARANKRRAAKLQALPKWLTKAEHEQIKELYTCAQMFKLYTGEEYHVDHIVPLQGENVCGLHVPWNLQVIPAKENLSKSNKLQEELL
jgi:hypothetical protein